MANILLVKALKQIQGYVQLMKDLVTKKRMVNYDPIDNVYHCSVIASRSLVEKKEDPGAFIIQCIIGSFNFAKAFYVLGETLT